MLKIIVVGDSGCGKTCLINRFVHGKFDYRTKATIACEYALKLYQLGDATLRLNIWDIAGQDSIGGINKLFCRQAAGAIVACDITNQETLENAVRWKEQLDEYCDSKCRNVFPVVLVANKYDLIRNFEEEGKEIDDYMQQDFLNKFSMKNGFVGCIRSSAKDDINVDECFKYLIESIIENNMTINQENGNVELNINKIAGNCGETNSILISYSQSFTTVVKPSVIYKNKSSCCK